jgi:hypothetical protein
MLAAGLEFTLERGSIIKAQQHYKEYVFAATV